MIPNAKHVYPGVALFIQSLLIFARYVISYIFDMNNNLSIFIFSTLILKFGRTEDD